MHCLICTLLKLANRTFNIWVNLCFFCLFLSFSNHSANLNWKKQSVPICCAWDLKLGRRMFGAVGSTKLWQPPKETFMWLIFGKVLFTSLWQFQGWSEKKIKGDKFEITSYPLVWKICWIVSWIIFLVHKLLLYSMLKDVFGGNLDIPLGLNNKKRGFKKNWTILCIYLFVQDQTSEKNFFQFLNFGYI